MPGSSLRPSLKPLALMSTCTASTTTSNEVARADVPLERASNEAVRVEEIAYVDRKQGVRSRLVRAGSSVSAGRLSNDPRIRSMTQSFSRRRGRAGTRLRRVLSQRKIGSFTFDGASVATFGTHVDTMVVDEHTQRKHSRNVKEECQTNGRIG